MSNTNMGGHVLCAVDVETTGTLAGYHEIIQIACVPLDHHFEQREDMRFRYMTIKPDHSDRVDKEATLKHKIKLESLDGCPTQDQSVELFHEWFNALPLGFGKRLVPLAHNWGFERAFLIHWLGLDGFSDVWHGTPRDTMETASFINDLYNWHGRQHPFKYVRLPYLCSRFDIPLHNAHDALCDSLATAKLYVALMQFLSGR